MQLYQVFISAEDKGQAETILHALLTKKLILGGPILEGPAKFWWKGEIVSMGYCYILSYTTEGLKERVIEETKKVSKEEIPMLSFVRFEGNPDFSKLVRDTLSSS